MLVKSLPQRRLLHVHENAELRQYIIVLVGLAPFILVLFIGNGHGSERQEALFSSLFGGLISAPVLVGFVRYFIITHQRKVEIARRRAEQAAAAEGAAPSNPS